MSAATEAGLPATAAPRGSPRWVVPFAEGNRGMRNLLGGKGANLAEMTRLGMPVPPGFVITTEACRAYLAAPGDLPEGLMGEVDAALASVEAAVGRRFGDPGDPLLVSVRSGAPFSMPGMMDTVLNLGLNRRTVRGLLTRTGDERFAWDAYRRFLALFGKVVLGVPGDDFDTALGDLVSERGVGEESGLGAADMEGLATTFERLIADATGRPFPEDPRAQLEAAVAAVFRSWNGRRARDYRRMEKIPDDLGTAVNVQAMVFGNLGPDSGSGVAFTRDPATGAPEPYGDWLTGAQGEDVVAGIRATHHLDELAQRFPGCYRDLITLMGTLEGHYRDLCDIEFTIERGRLYLLQTRVGKRTALAAVRIAVDLVDEGLIDEREAVTRVTPTDLERLLHPQFAPGSSYEAATRGLNASPGAAVGRVCLTADDAEAMAGQGERVILVRLETSPDDLHGMMAAEGILTARGGLVSHAAVVARGMGKPAVCGADGVRVDMVARQLVIDGTAVPEGAAISINGTTGEVVIGEVPLVAGDPGEHFGRLLGWADRFRSLGVRANADTPADAERAVAFGAEGIGLCRTEHMFLGDRLPLVQRMILAGTDEEEEAALEALLDVQRRDFVGILTAMDGRPVTVRLLDPPLHEFLPDATELELAEAQGTLGEQGRRLLDAARAWREENPMLGIRGCRLGILRPGLYRMQTRALVEAAMEVARSGGNPQVEIMIPLIVAAEELGLLAGWIRETVDGVLDGVWLDVRVGTMIETPRAALTAGRIAPAAEFFSFGTNDMTQMTYGFSRDDVEARLMPVYRGHGLLPADPFETLDLEGVGRLLRIAVEEGRAARPDLGIGVCGEHGGDPASVRACHELGLDYVSCSPYRLPVARLAAAHAAMGAAAHVAST